MRVTLVHSYYASGAPSGENVAVQLQALALERAGFPTTIVGVRTDDLVRRRAYAFRTAIGVATQTGIDPTRRVLETRPDVVHVHNLFPNFSTRWLAKWPGPMVATIHNYRPLCAAGTLARNGEACTECAGRFVPISALRYRCYRGSLPATVPAAAANLGGIAANALLRRADRVVFLAPRARAIYARAGYQRLDRAVILPNFVQPNPVPTLRPGERCGLPWLYFGRLATEKGVLRLIRNWPSGVPLHIYGGGPDKDEVARLSTGSIDYRGSMDRDKLLSILPRHRGLVFPSMFAEGLPTVYLESLAAGLPVVARSGNSAADDVITHDTGVTFDDFDGLGEALTRLESTYDEYSHAALRRYRMGYSPEAWVKGITAVYQAASQARSVSAEKP